MSSKLLSFTCWAFNHSPLFNVSCDDNFGTYKVGSLIRLSFVGLSICDRKLYLITVSGGKWSLFKILTFNELRPLPTLEIAIEKQNRYRDDISEMDDTQIEQHVAFLSGAKQHDITIKGMLQNKASVYGAVAVALATLPILELKRIFFEWDFSLYSLLLIASFIYLYLQVLEFLKLFLKNKTVCRSRFSDFKADGTLKKYAESLYLDWYCIKEERDIQASYVMNIQKYLVYSLIMAAIISLSPILKSITSDDAKQSNSCEFQQVSIMSSSGQLREGELMKLASLLSKKTVIKNILLVRNFEKLSDDYKHILTTLGLYFNKSQIEEVYLKDTNSESPFLIIKPMSRAK